LLVADALNLTNPDPSPFGFSELYPSIELFTQKYMGIISLGRSTEPPPPSGSSAPDEQLIISVKTKNKFVNML